MQSSTYRSTTSTAAGPCRRISGVAARASSRSANWTTSVALGARQLDQPQLRLDGHAQRPLRADEQVGEVEAQPPSPAPARERTRRGCSRRRGAGSWGSAGRSRRRARPPAAGPRGSRRLPGRPARTWPRARASVERPQVDDAAVGQHGLQLEHMIDRLAVDDRARAGGVVGDHAADRRAVRGGDVRRELQPVRLAAARFRSSSTQPGSTRTQRSSALISSTRSKYFEQSRMTPARSTGRPATCRRPAP